MENVQETKTPEAAAKRILMAINQSNVYGACLCSHGCKRAYTQSAANWKHDFSSPLILKCKLTLLRMARQMQ